MKEWISMLADWGYSEGIILRGWKWDGFRGRLPHPLYNVENMMLSSFLWYCLSTSFRNSSSFDSSLKYFPIKLA